uniref:Large ribosomal subunit protein mL49 n=1 Tax=Timema douglasi TaxID=61478 RepID=A0A7R8W1U0_TIMDO|nr:unnamed protein product [Timema douglasi]
MLSVYLYRGFRGQVRITQIVHIQGNIWALESDLKKYLLKSNKHITTQVHEVCGQINIRGDYVTQVQQWLLDKGF